MTTTDDSDMASAAISGVTKPATAKGTAILKFGFNMGSSLCPYLVGVSWHHYHYPLSVFDGVFLTMLVPLLLFLIARVLARRLSAECAAL